MDGSNDTSRLITLPNILTLFRITLVPVFILIYYKHPDRRWASMLVFALASLTDCLDGFLARRLNRISSLGKLMDPLADKLMVLSMLFCLKDEGLLAPAGFEKLNGTVLYTILAKEIIMVFGAGYMLKRGHVTHSNLFGKTATLLFCVGIIAVFPGNGTMPWHGKAVLQTAGRYIIPAAALASLAAMISYIAGSVKILRRD